MVVYDKQKDTIKGVFIDAEPKGVWKFKNQGAIKWEIYQNIENGYRISYPAEWTLVEIGNNTLEITNKDIDENSDLKVIVNSVALSQIEITLDTIYSSHLKLLNTDKNVSNIVNKEIDLIDINKGYEINYDIVINSIEYFNKEIIYEFNGMIYIVSSIIKKGINYDFEIIEEIITTSFRMQSDLLNKNNN